MPDATTLPTTDDAPRAARRRWLALVVVCLGMFMNALDGSIVNVALPAIQRDLHFSQAGLTWVVDAYLVTFGSLLLLAGRLGDLVGRKRVFLAGIAVFTLASAACGVAPDQAVLVIGRFVQGIGGALSSSVIIALIVTEFPAAGERAKAMSAYIFVAVGGGSIGLLVGGVLTQAVNWHWIFFINVPVGIATYVLGRVLIDEHEPLGVTGGVDVAGSVLVTASLMVAITAIVGATSAGWLSLRTLGLCALAAALAAGFVAVERRHPNPIVPFAVVRIPSLVRSSVVRGFLNTGMFATFFLGAIFLEHVLHYSPLRTGMAFLPLSLTMGALSTGITARLVQRFGNRRVLLPGMTAALAGLAILASAGAHASYWTDLFPGMLLIGLGAGTSFVPLLAIAMADVPVADAGLGSGVVNVSMQVTAALGLAALSTIAAGRTRALAAAGHGAAAALTGGTRLALTLATMSVLVGLGVAIGWLREPRPVRDGTGDGEERRLLLAENATEPLAT